MTLIDTKYFYSSTYIQGRLQIYQTNVSASNNTSYVTVKLAFRRTNTYAGETSTAGSNFVLGIDGNTKTVATSFSIAAYDNDWHQVGEYSRTVSHSSDGSKTVSVTSEYDRSTSFFYHDVSYSIALDTIPRQSTASASNINIGDTATIYTNRASSAFTHKITVTYGNTSEILGTSIESSVQWDTSGIADALLSLCPTSKYVTVTIETITYNGTTTIGTTTSTFRAYANVPPTITAASYKDDSSIAEITGNDQIIVKGKSYLVITVTAEAQQYTDLENASVTIGGTTESAAFSNGSASIDVGTITLNESTSISVVVTDSRGYTATQTLTINAVDYSEPSVVVSAKRKYGYYSETACQANVSFASVGGTNSITILVDGQQNGTGDYTNEEQISNYEIRNISFNNSYAWVVRFRVTDAFGTTVTRTVQIGKGIPILMIDRKHSSVGINQFPDNDDSVEITGSVYLNGKNMCGAWNELTLKNVTLTDESSVGTSLHVTPAYKVVGNEIYLRGHIALTAGSNVVVVEQLPEEARPTQGYVFWFAALTGANIARCRIGTDGLFIIEWIRDIATGTASTASISWLDISHVYSID